MVLASSEVPNSNFTYDLYYRNDLGNWVNITSNNGVNGLTPNRSYECRIRLNLDNVVQNGAGRNISIVFNHSSGNIPSFTVTPAQSNGYTITSSTYDRLEVINNSARTKTTFNVYNLVSPTYSYLYINFIFELPTMNTSQDPTNGIISIGVPSVDLEELSSQQLLDEVNGKLDNINDSVNHAANSINENNDNNTSSILSNLSSGFSGIFTGLTSLGSTITNAISTAVSNLISGLTNALEALFIPDSDELQRNLDHFKEDIERENALFGGVIGIFSTLFDTINTNVVQDTIHIPEFTFTVSNTVISVGNWDMKLFPVIPEGDEILGYVRLFTSVVVGVWLINMVFSYLLYTLGIGKNEEVSEE